MGRSQRHMIWEQGANAAGAIHDEGMVAPGIAMQVNPSEPNTMQPGEPLLNGGQERAGEIEGVEIPTGPDGGPLQGSTLTGPIPDSIKPPEPVPEAPTLESITPNTGEAGGSDITCELKGSGFTNETILVWNGVDDHAAYENATTMSTVVKLSTASVASICAVQVRNGDLLSNEITFEITGEQRALPAGPFTISLIEDHPDGLAFTVDGATDIRVNDLVTIEATGNTSVNGSYDVLAVENGKVIVGNDYELAAPIEAKGRITVG